MSSSKRTCFVVSPIGPENSEIRKHANDFLELLIEPALQRYDFDVIRADRIAQPSIITTDIVRLVQQSDLCIVDLTMHNPNVFYECGRRHETGLPCIQMIASGGDKLPFDVAGIRTVSYDLSSPRTVLESVRTLQQYIDNIVSSGFKKGSGGESLSSIAQTVERIERKLSQVMLDKSSRVIGSSPGSQDLGSLLMGPLDAFEAAIRKGDLDAAFSRLGQLQKVVPYKEYMVAVIMVTTLGHPAAKDIAEAEFEKVIGSDSSMDNRDELLMHFTTAFKKYFENLGDMQGGLVYLKNVYSRSAAAAASFEPRSLGYIANQVGMHAWLMGEHGDCVKYTKIASQHNPDEVAYLVNLAVAYKHMQQKHQLREIVDQLNARSDLEQRHRDFIANIDWED